MPSLKLKVLKKLNKKNTPTQNQEKNILLGSHTGHYIPTATELFGTKQSFNKWKCNTALIWESTAEVCEMMLKIGKIHPQPGPRATDCW